jgi:hypothetical protein
MAVPSDFANLVIWLKSDTGVFQDAAKATPCTVGSTVYTWANQGSGAFDFIQATAGTRPLFTTDGDIGVPVIDFASSKLLASTHAAYGASITMFVVGKRTVKAQYAMWVTNSAVTWFLANPPSDAKPYIYAGTIVASSVAAGLGREQITGQFNGASSFIRLNGTQTGSGAVGAATLSNTCLMRDPAGTYPMSGSLYEVCIYDRILSATEIRQIEAYLAYRYWLLPSSDRTGVTDKKRGMVGWLKKAVVNGTDFRYGTQRSDTEGSPETPSLEITEPNFFRFRWGVRAGLQTISVRAKQVSNVTGKRPQLRIKADPRIGVNADITGDAGAGAGWVTIGPVNVTPSAEGVLWVELWNMDTDTFNSSTFFDHVVTT